MLKLGKYGKVSYDGEEVNPEEINLGEFFIANLSSPVELEDDITMEELLDHYSHVKKFIYTYFSEHYNKLKVVVLSQQNTKHYAGVTLFKKMTIDEGELFFQPAIDFKTSGKDYTENAFMSELSVSIDKVIQVIEEVPGHYVNEMELTCKMTLQDVTEALFEDLIFTLTEGFTGVD